MLCLQPNGRWKKNATRCSYVINIVIIVIINNISYWLAFTSGTSGAHMLGRRAPAARRSHVSLHTCKKRPGRPCSQRWRVRGEGGYAAVGSPPHCPPTAASTSPSSASIPAMLAKPGPSFHLSSFWWGDILSPTALFWDLCVCTQPWVYRMRASSADAPLARHFAVGDVDVTFPWSEAPLAKKAGCSVLLWWKFTG